MARKDGRVEPGQPLSSAVSARAWNRAQDAADVVLGQRPGFAAGGVQGSSAPYTSVLCRNDSGSEVVRWGVLAVTGVAVTPTGATGPATSSFQEQPVLIGVTPTATTNDRFVIAVEPIKAASIGRVAVAGVVQCKLDVKNTADTTAGPKANSRDELQTGSGNATILFKESGTGADKWALIRMGGGGSGVRLGTVSATWAKGSTATVTQQNGDGTARSGTPTFTATNYFATVTVSSGTRRVACALIDSTWVLIAAECA